jgi:hypothetical protein
MPVMAIALIWRMPFCSYGILALTVGNNISSLDAAFASSLAHLSACWHVDTQFAPV